MAAIHRRYAANLMSALIGMTARTAACQTLPRNRACPFHVIQERPSNHQGVRMKRQLSMAGLLLAYVTLPACSSDTPSEPGGIPLEAQRDVMLSKNPLGDVAVGDLEKGDEVTALCFVRRAQTNAGLFGSAIKLRAGDLTAYAAVTDFPEDPVDRQAIFDLDSETLRDRLPACSR
jgi:hypothetical protein